MSTTTFRILFLTLVLVSGAAWADEQPLEIHNHIKPDNIAAERVALTLDACSGRYDEALIELLVKNRIPATIFATRRWLRRNPEGLAMLRAHADLFDIENHGANHVPAIVGLDREVYGIAGHPDMAHLRGEVRDGARAVEQATGFAPRWYRAATGMYDPQAIDEIRKLGFKIAGFSVNADDGASLSRSGVVRRLRRVKGGDVIIAHMNHPDSATAEGMALGLPELLTRGFVFVRLDQVELTDAGHAKVKP